MLDTNVALVIIHKDQLLQYSISKMYTVKMFLRNTCQASGPQSGAMGIFNQLQMSSSDHAKTGFDHELNPTAG